MPVNQGQALAVSAYVTAEGGAGDFKAGSAWRLDCVVITLIMVGCAPVGLEYTIVAVTCFIL